MYKWIMALLVSAACIFGLVVLVVDTSSDKPEQEPVAQGPAMPAVTLDQAAAETIYKKSCITCHGDQLEGKVGPNLQKVGTKLSTEQLYKLVLNGKGGMPAFKSSLKEEEAANLAQWLATHK